MSLPLCGALGFSVWSQLMPEGSVCRGSQLEAEKYVVSTHFMHDMPYGSLRSLDGLCLSWQ